MAETSLSDRLKLASETLSNSLGELSSLQGDEAFRYLNKDNLINLYKIEIEKKGITKFLEEIPNSLSGIRSTFLPFSLVRELSSELNLSISEIMSDSTSQKESYENAFMRMLGLPGSNFISQNLDITMLSSTGETSLVDYTVIENEILNERQKPYSQRKILIDNNIYNFKGYSPETTPDQPEDGTEYPNIFQIEKEFYSYVHLLIPPVQDSRISYCINEPNKIVPPNFSNPSGFQINEKLVRTSFLESVIRIRMDRLSGYSAISKVEDSEGEYNVDSNSFGILESLFILRLESALRAFSQKLASDIESLKEIQEQTGKIPTSPETKNENSPKVATDTKDDDDGYFEEVSDDQILYEKQKIIEDSIMALLDDNSKAIDLQEDTQRKSSIKDSHIISNLIGIIDLPRQRIDESIRDISKSKLALIDGEGGRKVSGIDSVIGSSQGVGVLHILVFALALFSIPEEYLLGLLSDLEYQKFLEEFQVSTQGFFGTGISSSPGLSRVETQEAIKVLTDYILEGYDIFKYELEYSQMPLGSLYL